MELDREAASARAEELVQLSTQGDPLIEGLQALDATLDAYALACLHRRRCYCDRVMTGVVAGWSRWACGPHPLGSEDYSGLPQLRAAPRALVSLHALANALAHLENEADSIADEATPTPEPNGDVEANDDTNGDDEDDQDEDGEDGEDDGDDEDGDDDDDNDDDDDDDDDESEENGSHGAEASAAWDTKPSQVEPEGTPVDPRTVVIGRSALLRLLVSFCPPTTRKRSARGPGVGALGALGTDGPPFSCSFLILCDPQQRLCLADPSGAPPLDLWDTPMLASRRP